MCTHTNARMKGQILPKVCHQCGPPGINLQVEDKIPGMHYQNLVKVLLSRLHDRTDVQCGTEIDSMSLSDPKFSSMRH